MVTIDSCLKVSLGISHPQKIPAKSEIPIYPYTITNSDSISSHYSNPKTKKSGYRDVWNIQSSEESLEMARLGLKFSRILR